MGGTEISSTHHYLLPHLMNDTPTPSITKRRLSPQHIHNLQGLIYAYQFVTDCLEKSKENMVHFPLEELPSLDQAIHFEQLFRDADRLLGEAKRQQRAAIIQMKPYQRALNIAQSLFGRRLKSDVSFKQRFQNPVQFDLMSGHTVLHPMCFLFVALRLEESEQ